MQHADAVLCLLAGCCTVIVYFFMCFLVRACNRLQPFARAFYSLYESALVVAFWPAAAHHWVGKVCSAATSLLYCCNLPSNLSLSYGFPRHCLLECVVVFTII